MVGRARERKVASSNGPSKENKRTSMRLIFAADYRRLNPYLYTEPRVPTTFAARRLGK